MSGQCCGITEHGSEGIGDQTLVGIAVELSLEVVQAMDAIEVLLHEPVAPLAVPLTFVPLLATQELQAVLIILATVASTVAIAGTSGHIDAILQEVMLYGGRCTG